MSTRLILVAFLAVCATCSGEQIDSKEDINEVIQLPPDPSEISGRVTNINGQPLVGITVQTSGKVTATNASGNYVLSNLRLGTYTVRFSGGGFTFGSDQFQIDQNTRILSSVRPVATSPTNPVVNAIGYNRDPIVYVHGWTDAPSRFQPHPSQELAAAGYAPFFATLQTTLGFTPPLETNVNRLIDAIADAKYRTGQSKVILIAHSMGGLVARVYLETWRYKNDVSQFFSFGSPHLGTPLLTGLACLPNQLAVCQMTAPAMILFNLTHFKRSGVDYHEIGGDAPVWTSKELFCFRLFGHKHCVSIPWPDHSFRNALGWIAGELISGPDDGLIGTCSAIGQLGSGIDRFVTQEVHMQALGPRGYFDWNGGRSQQSFDHCLQPVLVAKSTTTCGSRSLATSGCLLNLGQSALAARASAGPRALLTTPSATSTAIQRATPQQGVLLPGQQLTRTVVVEGGGTTFSVNVQSGSVALSLIDPTGQVIDPAYVASITQGSPSDSDAEISTEIPNEAMTYDSTPGTARYYVPNARRGVWQVTVIGNADLPVEGSMYTSDVEFDSSFFASFTASSSFLRPGTAASFTVQIPKVASASSSISVTLPDGLVQPLAPITTTTGASATFTVPSQSGYVRVRWSITGTRTDGVPFERGGVEEVQISSTALTWSAVYSETTPQGSDWTLLGQLVLRAGIFSTYTGDAEVFADLVDTQGNLVTHLTQRLTLTKGNNPVDLTFAGLDIYASFLDGPYTLTNVYVLDTRAGALLATTAIPDYTTAAYRVSQFAPAHGAPSVTTSGPYWMFAGDALRLDARGADPEGGQLTYAWDLDGDGIFESPGRTPQYIASSGAETRRVSVRATDSTGMATVASTTIEVSVRHDEVNLSLQATASASSSYLTYWPFYVRDNDISNPYSTSWRNNVQQVCHVGTSCMPVYQLPATVDLDFGVMRTLSRVTLYADRILVIQDYDVSIWDGSGWNVVERVLGNTALIREHSFVPTLGSRLRITGYRGLPELPGAVSINELQVFGY